jgi:hypothetical protein
VQRPRALHLPDEDLVLVIDAMWFQFAGSSWVLYLVGAKAMRARTAVFLDPVLLPGRETSEQWRHVLAGIPEPIRARVRAVVSDNLRGLTQLVTAGHWVSQLCHFHLISQLHGRRGRHRPHLADRVTREQLYQLTRQALECPDGPRLRALLRRLAHLVAQPIGSGRLRMVVREFLRRVDAYRAYQQYPQWQLPTTTGAAEAMGGRIRTTLARARHVNTPHALRLWATAVIRLHPTVTCNGRHQPNSFV